MSDEPTEGSSAQAVTPETVRDKLADQRTDIALLADYIKDLRTATPTQALEIAAGAGVFVPTADLPPGTVISITITIGPPAPAPAPAAAPVKRYLGGPQ